MEEIRVNRLPLLTYRYLHTNDTPLSFEPPKGAGSFTFSDMTCVREGGSLPENFDGASKETVLTAEKGSHYTITIPEGKSQHLVIDVQPTADAAAASSSVWKGCIPFPHMEIDRGRQGRHLCPRRVL